MASQAGTWTKRRQSRKGCCGECASQTRVLLCVSLRSPEKKGLLWGEINFWQLGHRGLALQELIIKRKCVPSLQLKTDGVCRIWIITVPFVGFSVEEIGHIWIRIVEIRDSESHFLSRIVGETLWQLYEMMLIFDTQNQNDLQFPHTQSQIIAIRIAQNLLLCARHCFKHFPWIISISFSG